MTWLLVSLRRLRAERLQALGLGALVLVTAFVFALAPRLLDRVGDAALRQEVASAPLAARNIELTEERRIEANPRAPMFGVRAAGERAESRMPDGVRELISDRTFVAESPRWNVFNETLFPSTIVFRFHADAASRIRYVEGEAPTVRTFFAPFEAQPPDTGPRPPQEVVTFEVALSPAAAERIGVGVGDVLYLGTDVSDRLATGHPAWVGAQVTGLFEVADTKDPYWFGDASLARPRVRPVTSELQFVDAYALLAPEAYDPLLRTTEPVDLPLRYAWRYFIDPSRLEVERLAATAADARRLEGTFSAQQGLHGPARGTLLRTGLLRLLDGHAARWQSAEVVLTVVAIGPAAVAAAAVGLLAVLAAERRRNVLATYRGRGASGRQILASMLLEGLLLAGPAAVLAAGLAVLAASGGGDAVTLLAVAAVASGAVILLLVAVAPAAVSPLRAARQTRVVRRPGPRRLAFEVLVVLLAAGGAYLLRERGVSGASSTGALAGADPFIAAVPALAGLAAGLVAVRALPLPLGLLARLAAGRRDLVPVLALRRATREAGGAPVLVVLLATTTIGAFSSATLVHLDRGATVVAWQEIGAPYRFTDAAGPLPADFDAAVLPGVEEAARSYRVPATAQLGVRLELLAIDVQRYGRIVSDTPAAVAFPNAMLAAPGGPGPYPALVSTELAEAGDGIEVGETFRVSVDGHTADFRAVGTVDSFPTMPVAGRFAVVSLAHLESVDEAALPLSAVFARAPDDAAPRIRSALRDVDRNITLASRAERSEAFRTSPVVAAVSVGVAAAALVAAAYAALAVASSLVLAGAARAVETAHLRTLGLTRRETVGLLVAEHGPTVVLAFVLGTALGLGLFSGLRSALGLPAVVGTDLAIPLEVDPVHLALLLLATVVTLACGVVLAAALQRRATPVAAIRRGIE